MTAPGCDRVEGRAGESPASNGSNRHSITSTCFQLLKAGCRELRNPT